MGEDSGKEEDLGSGTADLHAQVAKIFVVLIYAKCNQGLWRAEEEDDV